MSYGKTQRGYDIKSIYTDKEDGRKYVVAERKKGAIYSPDYLVGAGYNKKFKDWDQGYYDYPTLAEAQTKAKELAGKYDVRNEKQRKKEINQKVRDCVGLVEKNKYGAWVVYGDMGHRQYYGLTKSQAMNSYKAEYKKELDY